MTTTTKAPRTPVQVKATLVAPDPKFGAVQQSTPIVYTAVLLCKAADGKMVEAIDIRAYSNPRGNGMQPVRASVWLRAFDRTARTGRGSAGQCGYHKESQAIAEALHHAGVRLWGETCPSGYVHESAPKPDFKREVDFGGTGASGYEAFCKAIAKAMGYKGAMHFVGRNCR